MPGSTPGDVAWIADESSRDFLGNEFLLWLWYQTDMRSDTIALADDSEATVMIARTLTLECPRGQTGHETISSEGPSRLPEARRAIQSGKLPRKAGLTVVRHDAQYELALHAETLAVASAKMPNLPDEVTDARAKLDERATQTPRPGRDAGSRLRRLRPQAVQRRLGRGADRHAAVAQAERAQGGLS